MNTETEKDLDAAPAMRNPNSMAALLMTLAHRAQNPMPGPRVSKHQGSKKNQQLYKATKKGFEPKIGKKFLGHKGQTILTNHERVMAGRAERLGLTILQYQIKAGEDLVAAGNQFRPAQEG